jgi:hypothetical protein
MTIPVIIFSEVINITHNYRKFRIHLAGDGKLSQDSLRKTSSVGNTGECIDDSLVFDDTNFSFLITLLLMAGETGFFKKRDRYGEAVYLPHHALF